MYPNNIYIIFIIYTFITSVKDKILTAAGIQIF